MKYSYLLTTKINISQEIQQGEKNMLGDKHKDRDITVALVSKDS